MDGKRKEIIYLAKKLIELLDTDYECTAKSIFIWYDFSHHEKREIHLAWSGEKEIIIKTNKKNKNYEN